MNISIKKAVTALFFTGAATGSWASCSILINGVCHQGSGQSGVVISESGQPGIVIINGVVQQTIVGNGIQRSEVRSVAAFNALDVGGVFSATAQVGRADQQVVITGDENLLPYITTEVQGDELSIGAQQGISLQPKLPLTADIQVQSLNRASTSGLARLTVQGVNEPSFDFESSGKSSGTVIGTASQVNLESSGGSSINAGELRAQRAEAGASGTSTLTINASESLTARASGKAKMFFLGNPTVQKRVSGKGSVQPR